MYELYNIINSMCVYYVYAYRNCTDSIVRQVWTYQAVSNQNP
jgi:hypothetical protein